MDELIRRAAERFNSLAPEEQEEHLRQQRDSWVRGEMAMGLDRDEARHRRRAMADMRHMDFLEDVLKTDLRVLQHKEKTYKGSWKKRGGVGAFMMMARKWDRIEGMMESCSYDVLQKAQLENFSEEDGCIMAEIGDLRRYLTLTEAECRARQAGRPNKIMRSSGMEEPRGYDAEAELGKETVLEEYDDGTRITMDSYSGGGSAQGIWGRMVIRKTLRDGTTMTRTLEATEDWQIG